MLSPLSNCFYLILLVDYVQTRICNTFQITCGSSTDSWCCRIGDSCGSSTNSCLDYRTTSTTAPFDSKSLTIAMVTLFASFLFIGCAICCWFQKNHQQQRRNSNRRTHPTRSTRSNETWIIENDEIRAPTRSMANTFEAPPPSYDEVMSIISSKPISIGVETIDYDENERETSRF